MIRDVALAQDEAGNSILHRADCPDVQARAAAGEAVFTVIGCKRLPPRGQRDIHWHTCLDPH